MSNDEFVLISCPDCRGCGKEIETWYSMNIFSGYREFESRTNKNCSRCGGLGKLKVKYDDIREE